MSTGTTTFEYTYHWGISDGHVRNVAAIYLKIGKKYGLITIAHSHSTASRGNKFKQIAKNIMQYPIRYISDYMFACSDEVGKWLFGKNVNFRVIKMLLMLKNLYLMNPRKMK